MAPAPVTQAGSRPSPNDDYDHDHDTCATAVETPAVHPQPVSPPRARPPCGCGPALAYLTAYAYPGFPLESRATPQGRQGMTCIDVPGTYPGEHLIVTADVCSS